MWLLNRASEESQPYVAQPAHFPSVLVLPMRASISPLSQLHAGNHQRVDFLIASAVPRRHRSPELVLSRLHVPRRIYNSRAQAETGEHDANFVGGPWRIAFSDPQVNCMHLVGSTPK